MDSVFGGGLHSTFHPGNSTNSSNQHQQAAAAAAAARRASAGAAAAIVAAAVAANNAAAAAAAGTSPAQSHGSANSSLRMRQSSRLPSSSTPPPHPSRSPFRPSAAAGNNPNNNNDDCGVDTLSPGETGALTPGSTFDASEVDRCVVNNVAQSVVGVRNASNSVSASGGILDRVARELSHYSRADVDHDDVNDDDDHSRRFVFFLSHLQWNFVALKEIQGAA